MTWILKIKSRHSSLFYFLCYSAFFVCMSLLVFSWFCINDKSFVFRGDGLEQHMNALDYYGEYLRGIIKGLLYEHRLNIPMFDMNIGYGSDIITTLHYYVIGDPLALLSVFVSGARTEVLYTVLIFLRLFLAGVSFSIYSFYHKNQRFPTLIGALCYCFCGYCLYAGIRHPYFVNPMIYLPLLLIGIDKILRKERPYLFIIMTGVSALSNFYFFYMLCIFMFIYAVFRYVATFKKINGRDLIGWFLKFAGYFLIGISIACVILLPVLFSALSTSRAAAENYIPILYEIDYYGSMLTKIIQGGSGYWSVMGYSPIVLLSVFVLFSVRKKNTDLKIGFLLLTLFLCIPYIGHMINGFSYVSNRWIWAYSMLNAYILVKMLPQMPALTVKEKRRTACFVFCYVLACILVPSARTQAGYGSVIILILIGTFLLLADVLHISFNKIRTVLLLSACGGIVWVAFGMYSVSESDYMNSFYDRGAWYNTMYHHAASQLIHAGQDKTIYRYDQMEATKIYNTSMQQKLNSTCFYFSLANGVISDYFEELYLNFSMEQKYNNLDSRSILDALASVKYFITKKSMEAYLPYNYNETFVNVKGNGKTFLLYEGSNVLPLGYTYDSYIKREAYDEMTVTKKQQALLQGCVLSESSLPDTVAVFDDLEIEYEMIPRAGITAEEGKIKVTKKNAAVTLHFEGLSDSETYIVFDNLQMQGIHPNDLYTKEEWNKLSAYERNKLIFENKDWKPIESYTLTMKTGNITKSIYARTNRYSFYNGRHNYLCNLGYTEAAKQTLEIVFPSVGIYSYDDLRIICQPVDNINRYIDERKEDVLEDIVVSANLIEGSITLDEPKVLLLSVPYSKGFRVFVDGREEKPLQANTMFLGVELTRGNHQVQFRYETPLIRWGLGLSVAGLAVFLLLIYFFERKRVKLIKK